MGTSQPMDSATSVRRSLEHSNGALNTSSNLSTKVSVVTASYNQGRFIDATINSVLNQTYRNFEYVVIDGGSSDESVDVIRHYADQLTYWVSEPDGGQMDAINKGFAHTSGDIMAWLNSDDMYLPWAFAIVTDIFATFPQIEWLTSQFPIVWDENGRAVQCIRSGGFNRKAYYRGANLPGGDWYNRGFILQEATFWRRSLWDRAGGYVDLAFPQAGDFELWTRFFKHADMYAVATPLAGFRTHAARKFLARGRAEYLELAKNNLVAAGGRPYGRIESRWRSFLGRGIDALTVKPPARGITHGLTWLMSRLGVLYAAPVCRWTGEGWSIDTSYFV